MTTGTKTMLVSIDVSHGKNFHHTLNMLLLHYLAKCKRLKMTQTVQHIRQVVMLLVQPAINVVKEFSQNFLF